MLKKAVVICFLAFFVLSLSGCATARKKKDLQIQSLRNQISVLEAQIQSKDEEIDSLRASLSVKEESQAAGSSEKKVIGEVKSRPNTKQIQIALRNAGYNPGPIDGKKGKQTKDAIKAFQRDNNLVVDGKVGRQTWDLLKEYLYKKIK